jgi:hypothetical protein
MGETFQVERSCFETESSQVDFLLSEIKKANLPAARLREIADGMRAIADKNPYVREGAK